MKKVLLSLLAVAALVLSCQNYDDEFASLNSKIASLESQITSLAELRTAITGVQSTVGSLQTAVAAAQASAASAATQAAAAAAAAADAVDSADESAVASAAAAAAAATAAQANATSVAALATSLAAIAADITDLETAVAAASTSADLDALKSELTDSLDALDALIDANTADIVKILANNASLSSALTALGVDLKALIEANADDIADLVANDAVVQASLRELGVDVDSIIALNATFEGNLTITSVAELVFAKSLGNKVSTIKGNVYVLVDETKLDGSGTGTGLTAAGVNEVLSKMQYVIGNLKLVTDASLDVSALISVTGDYIVSGHDVSDDALIAVGDDVYFNYDGAYTSNIQTADNIYLVIKDDALASATNGTAARTGTTSIDFLALTKASGVQSIAANSTHTSGGSLSLGSSADTKIIAVNENASSVKIGQAPVIAVTSGTTAATTALTAIELHYAADLGLAASGLNPNGVAALASLTLTGAKISTAVVKAKQITGAVAVNVQASTATSNSASVDLSSALSIGDLLVSNANSNNISALKTVGGILFTEQTTFSTPELTTSVGDIDLVEATTFSAPKLARVSAAIASGSTEQATAAYNITADKVTGSVSLPALTKAKKVSMDLVTTFSAPLAKVELIDIEEATATVTTEIELGSLSTYGTLAVGSMSDVGTVDVVKLHNQDITFDLTTLVQATAITYKGKANASGVAVVDATISAANPLLKTLSLGGVLNTVSITTGTTTKAQQTALATALTSVTTSGTIVSFTVNQVFSLTSLSLDHTDDAKSVDAATIVVTNNHSLASLKTSVASVKTLDVTGNGKLGSLDFNSLSKVPNNFVVDNVTTGIVAITITGNYTDLSTTDAVARGYVTKATTGVKTHGKWIGLKGTFSAVTNSQNEVYGQSGLATLKTFIDAVEAKHTNSSGAIITPNRVTIALDYVAANADAALESAVNSTLTGADAAAYARYANMQ